MPLEISIRIEFHNQSIMERSSSSVFYHHAEAAKHYNNKKLSYRKDDRVIAAMRPIYECPENFLEFLTVYTSTFPEISRGFFFRLML